MYLTLIHMGGGGTEEIAHAWAIIGPFATYRQADEEGEVFYQRVRTESKQYRQEVWHSIVEIPDHFVSATDAANKFLEDVGALTA